MAIASTFWLLNWGSFERVGNPDTSLYWDIPINSLFFDDAILAKISDTDIPTFQSSGIGYLDYLGGSGLSNPSIIPDSSIINGIQVDINRYVTGTDILGRFILSYISPSNAGISITDSIVQLVFNGNFIGNNKAIEGLWPQSISSVASYGGENDTWGLSGSALTSYLVKNSGFGISISPFASWRGLLPSNNITNVFPTEPPFIYGPQGGLNSNVRIDSVKLTVFYTEITNQNVYPDPIGPEEDVPNDDSLSNTTQYYYSDYLIAKNIARKDIPDENEICGIVVNIRRKGSDTTVGHTLQVYDETVQLYYQGNLIGNNKAKVSTLWPDINTEGYQIESYGSLSDLWGLQSLTAATVADENFGVALNLRYKYDDENDVDNINVDYIEIELCYQPSGNDQEIFPNPIDSEEEVGIPALIKRTETIFSQIYSPAYEVGYFDILALSRNINIDPQYDLAFSAIDTNYLFAANNLNLNYKQESNFGKRLAGEGASPNTFKVDTRTYDLSFSIPLRVESWGYLDTVMSAIYDYFIQGYKGSSTTYLGRILSDDDDPLENVSTLKVDNIVDFMNLSTPFTAYIRSDDDSETGETVTVTNVNKSTKILTLSSPTNASHTPSLSYIWAKPSNPETNREPSFSLFSLREGLLSGCVVDSISLNITPGQAINANVKIKFTNLDRKYQSNLLANFDSIAANVNDRKPNFLVNGSQVSIESKAALNTEFNLGDAKNSPLFRGFEEHLIRDFEVNEFTLEFNNNLQAIYSLNAKSNSFKKNFDKNLQPYAYYSNGRSITGTLKYTSPIKPWLFAEKLAGPPSINKQKLVVNFGPFKLQLPEIVWSPDSASSGMDQNQQKSVSFSVAVEELSYDPYFEPTGNL